MTREVAAAAVLNEKNRADALATFFNKSFFLHSSVIYPLLLPLPKKTSDSDFKGQKTYINLYRTTPS